MGTLKDEMRGVSEDHKPCERADDGERPGGSDGSAEPEGPPINTSQESSTQESYQPKLHSHEKETKENPTSRDEEVSGGVCDTADQSDSTGVKDSDVIGLTQQPHEETAPQNHTTISDKILSDGDGDVGIQGGTSEDKNTCHDRKKGAEIENISMQVPPTPGPCEPCTPAPFGQHHMRTQVSLEVVQCRSAATSPMTPPEGSHSFFFPSSFGRSEGVGTDTKDAELQVGQQVELCSVATSPMTPKTPYTTAFSELIGREERVRRSEGQEVEGSFPATNSKAEAESEITALKFSTSKEPSEGFSSNEAPEGSTRCPAVGSTDSRLTVEDSKEQSKQQRMGSMDQDITILVTHYGNNEEEEKAESETEMVKIDECEEIRGNDVKKENIPTDAKESSTSACDEAKTDVKCESSEAACEDVPMSKPPVPESPAPFGCHNIRTQVSLEVVQCQSVATSPMTPPEGDQAFCFPSSGVRCGAVGAETKDAELQVGQLVEYRSVATAPMTPRTPTITAFPEVRKETSLEEKIVEEEEKKDEEEEEEKKDEVVEEEEEKKEQDKEEDVKEEEKKLEEEDRNCKEKCEEPVQEVSWDEKGMTWEVYGAVVEVTVLGSAIQKHLEKQVKKQKRQPSMPPPPPLAPSAMPLASEGTNGGSGKGKRGEQDGEVGRRRRNPFRQLMENMQQPHCCSRAHSAE
uniref:G protein-regulated inducer of neurite outgrowth 1 n=1 Tax=Semicossyphus pulcher TaxID=241346 RepID=UPI0037E94A16